LTEPIRDAHETHETDEALFLRFRRTLDEDAFDALVARHAKRAHAVALSFLKEPAAAEDAVQEALLRLVRAREKFRRDLRFAEWFYALLRNCCRDEMRRRVRSPVEDAGSQERTVHADPHGQVETRERAHAARRALDALAPPEREVLVLRVHGGLGFPEIAAACGITTEAAKKRAYRALERLRRELADGG